MIPESVRLAYSRQAPLAEILLQELQGLFSTKKDSWFFTARAKKLDSFAQKIESGKVPDPAALEDFVGAMLVVPMLTNIAEALEFIEDFFIIDYRRPDNDAETIKKASEFTFDDIRLYGRLRPPSDLPPRPIDSIVFEIQVKTFLQHAWSIATHDLVYKFDRVSWARSRVAYQLKAVLEHAELSVVSIEKLEQGGHLPSVGHPEHRHQLLIEYIGKEWSREFLPQDLRRLAMNIDRVLTAIGIESDSMFKDLIIAGRAHYDGDHPNGWSPYQCVVDYASLFHAESLKRLITSPIGERDSFYVYVTPEILDRLAVTESNSPRARV